MVSRYHVFILSSSHARILSCSRALMLLSVCRLYCEYRRIIGRNQNASPSTSPTSARSAQVRPSLDVMLSCLRALEPSCSRILMLSRIHALGLSSRYALLLSCPKLSYRKESGNALLFCSLASRLVFSDSLPSSLFIPSERIRSLSNSLPVLARTGFENRAPVEAGRPFLKIKVP